LEAFRFMSHNPAGRYVIIQVLGNKRMDEGEIES